MFSKDDQCMIQDTVHTSFVMSDTMRLIGDVGMVVDQRRIHIETEPHGRASVN